jgi:death-on-curing protein
MAAAYLFHLVKNHGFVDGNKRVGMAAALAFLKINGIDTTGIVEGDIESLTLAVADGSADKSVAAAFFRERIEMGE